MGIGNVPYDMDAVSLLMSEWIDILNVDQEVVGILSHSLRVSGLKCVITGRHVATADSLTLYE